MSEEQELEQQEQQTEQKAVSIEALASSYGWDPERGEKTAEEYIKYALDGRKKVREKNKEIGEMRIVLDQLANDLKKQKEVGYNQAIAEIEQRKQQAVQSGDYQSLKNLEVQEKQLQNDRNHDPAREAVFEDFRIRNADWIEGTKRQELEIQGYANMIDQALLKKNLSASEHVARLEEALTDKFPQYFNQGYVEHAKADVEPVQQESNVMTKSSKKKTYTINDLNEAQKIGAKYMAERGHMTVEQYIAKLAENGDLK